MNKSIFLLLIIFSITTSCQKHLDRADAKRMIAENKNYPQKQNYNITKGFVKDMNTEGRGVTIVLGEDETKKEENTIKQFESMGLLKLTETPHREETSAWLLGTTVRTWKSVKIELTDLGRNYLVSEDDKIFTVMLWETDVKEVTGVQERPDLKIAEAEYVIQNINITPFGSVFSDKNMEHKRSAEFSLYDDGWRIQ